ncbi:GNAT family N-acetyltransferase [Enorma massiliensis]|uniref:GNAT family N-acetyltransferase n=1 Tax=Enorma massiliensis TaxID=1472761 RepID=UPI001950C97D|nr:GNAT family N-acetyltransferase [Enorma massiliensis]
MFKTRWYNGAMNIRRVSERSKRDYLKLLLLADEQEDMIDRYLGRGTMFALDIAGKTVGVCVVTDEGDRMLEIKNLAVDPAYQRRGLGRALIEFIARNAKGTYDALQVGTGTALSRCPFTRHAVSYATTASRISSSTTTTILSWRQAFCLKIWFTCGEVCKAMG